MTSFCRFGNSLDGSGGEGMVHSVLIGLFPPSASRAGAAFWFTFRSSTIWLLFDSGLLVALPRGTFYAESIVTI